MRRLPALAAVLALALAIASPAAAVDDCVEGGPPPQPAGGTIQFSPRPTVNHKVLILPRFDDQRPYVDGSMRVTVQQPDGSSVTFNPDTQSYKAKQIGRHIATATAQYIGCTRSADPPDYVTDTAGPTPFQVGDEVDPTMSVRAMVRRHKAGGTGNAVLQANVICPDSTFATSQPVTFTLYYETGGRQPGHSSPHIAGTSANGCLGSSGKDTRGRRKKRLYTMNADGGSADLNVLEPQRMRVLIEMTRGTVLLAAARASFKKVATGESVTRDSGSCAGAPKGCQRFKTTVISPPGA